MAPKKNKGKKKVTMNLADFNPDAARKAVEPELVDLPSAPKLAEEWDAVGGRPEYNSRGFKERTVTNSYDDHLVDDEEFAQRDWSRSGPLDDGEDETGAGRGGGDRSWDSMRRGPMDADEGDGVERSWDGMRRGPMDADDAAAGPERSWDGMRRGPVDAVGAQKDVDFGSARRGPVDAEFESKGDVDFSQRRGPVEAEFGNAGRGDVDFSARRGPVEAEFAQKSDIDFSTRRGPVEASFEGSGAREVDFAVRSGPVDAVSPTGADRDFSAARRAVGAVDAAAPTGGAERDFGAARKMAQAVEQTTGKSSSDIDFGSARRGRGIDAEGPTPPKDSAPANGNAMDWNVRKGPMDAAVAGRVKTEEAPRGTLDFGAARSVRSSQGDHGASDTTGATGQADRFGARGSAGGRLSGGFGSDSPADAPKERDWGRARRGPPAPMRTGGAPRQGGVSEATSGMARTSLNDAAPMRQSQSSRGGEDDGNWTTVRAPIRRPSAGAYVPRARGGRGGFSRGRGARLVPTGDGGQDGLSGDQPGVGSTDVPHVTPVAAPVAKMG